MNLASHEPAPLSVVLSAAYQAPDTTPDAPPRLVLENDGDVALAEARYADALALYKATRASSWRIRSKMGWCCSKLEKWAAGARYLADAPRRGEALPLLALTECVAALNDRNGERDQELDGLVRILLTLHDPAPRAYELAEAHLIDEGLRLEQLRSGCDRYPLDTSLRRRYVRAVWAAGEGVEQLLQLVNAMTDAPNAAPEDLWQGVEIASDLGQRELALALAQRLAAGSPLEEQVPLALVEADLHVAAGLVDVAASIYRSLIESIDGAGAEERAIALRAANALLAVAVDAGNQGAIRAAADDLVEIICQGGPMCLVERGPFLDQGPLRLQIGSQLVHYRPRAQVLQLRAPILSAVKKPDVLGILQVLFATEGGPGGGLQAEERKTLILSAGMGSAHPAIQRHVAWARMEAGDFEGAGRAFALFEVARVRDDRIWARHDDGSMFDEAPYDDEMVVDHFADGMISTLAAAAAATDRSANACQHFHNIATAYLRVALLHHGLYTRFHAMMEAIIGAFRAAGTEPTATLWFDYGLSCQYVSRKDLALEAYGACLALRPHHSAARANQLLLAPPEERASMIIGHALDNLAQSKPPAAIADLRLIDAVYLLTLHRACGGAEDTLVLSPFGESERPFAPTQELLQPLFALLRAGLVRISRQSPASAFTIEEAPARVSAFALDQLYWELPEGTLVLLRDLEQARQSRDWPTSWRRQIPELAFELARHECLAYLRFCADDRRLPVSSGEKTMQMIDDVLATYSVSQAYSFIWHGAAAAADFRKDKGVSALYAGNSIIGNCQRRIEEAREKKWAVAGYKRPPQVRRSHLSAALFDAMLGLRDRAFHAPLAQLFGEKSAGQR
ncbi:hypothetical protein [Massilia varians]|uniref:hypothetical protein n=1 Tax=Massilia varians TaxID=457921 RepID=UPI002557AEF3|nr:hypothetical protein [Massilia varians]MDK6079501.1 hypothetical protein [Massilia varians]